MKRLCKIEFYFRSQYFNGIVFLNKQTAFSEYHVRLFNPDVESLIDGYYFIEGFDGSLELNAIPATLLQKEFLNEIGEVVRDIQLQLSFNKINQIVDHKVSFIPPHQSDINPSPSAAA